jgi:hypothetical protein
MDKYYIYIPQLIVLVSVIPYVYGISKNKIIPNPISWILWSIIGTVLFITVWSNPNSDSATIIFAAIIMINPMIVSLLSIIKKLKWIKVDRWDVLAVLISLIAITFYYFQSNKEGLIPLVLAITADVCAFIPTIKSAIRRPVDDRPAMWLCFMLGALLTIISIEELNWTSGLLPGYMMICSCFVIFPLIRFRLKMQIPLREWI